MVSKYRVIQFRRIFFKEARVDDPNVIRVFALKDEKSLSPYVKIDTDCTICKLIVMAVKTIVSMDNITVAEVERALDTVCQKVLFWISGPCRDFVHKYYNLFAQLIITAANEDKICTILKACDETLMKTDGARAVENNRAIVPVDQSSNELCATCEEVSNKVKHTLENPRVAQAIKEDINKACTEIPNLFPLICQPEHRKLIENFIDNIKNFDTHQFCKQMNMCKELSNFNKNGNELCMVCEVVSNKIKQTLANPRVARMIKEDIDKACTEIPHLLPMICIPENRKRIENFIDNIKNFDTEQFCKQIQMCEQLSNFNKNGLDRCLLCKIASGIVASVLKNNEIEQMMKDDLNKACDALPDILKKMCRSKLEKNWNGFIQKLNNFNPNQFCRENQICSIREELPVSGNNGQSCMICKGLLNDVKSMLANPHNAQTIKHIINKACSDIPYLLPAICKPENRKRIEDFIDNIKNFDTEQYCKEIKLCKELSNFKKIGLDRCLLCKIASGIVASVLKNNEIEQMMKDDLNKACDALPDILKKMCRSKLEKNWNGFIQKLNNFNPNQFCRENQLCSIWEELPVSGNNEGQSCKMCKGLLNDVKSMLENPHNAQTIKHVINKACSDIPYLLPAICKPENRKRIEDFIDNIKNFDTEQYCKEIKLCKELTNFKKIGLNRCLLCKIASGVVVSVIKNNEVAQMVKDDLNKACDALPGALKNMCHKKLEKNWADFIRKLNNFDPEQFCRENQMCATWENLQITSNNGMNQCTFCKILTEAIVSALKDPQIEQMIKDALSRTCEALPAIAKALCRSNLKKHWIDFINMINNFNGDYFCRKNQLCSVWKELPVTDNRASDMHQTCIMLGNSLQTLIKNTDVLEDLYNEVNHICTHPETEYMCRSAVKTYWPEWINQIKTFNMEGFCGSIKMKFDVFIVAT